MSANFKFLIQILIPCFISTPIICDGQGVSPMEYIDAGVKLVEIFKKGKNTKIDEDCVYEVVFNNSSDNPLKINIFSVTNDSIINTIKVPERQKSTIYSLPKGVHRYRIYNDVDELKKTSEFMLKECGALEFKIE